MTKEQREEKKKCFEERLVNFENEEIALIQKGLDSNGNTWEEKKKIYEIAIVMDMGRKILKIIEECN
jgi:hypothetical protein